MYLKGKLKLILTQLMCINQMKIQSLLAVLVRYIVHTKIIASRKYLDVANFKPLDLSENLEVFCHVVISWLLLDLHCIERRAVV